MYSCTEKLNKEKVIQEEHNNILRGRIEELEKNLDEIQHRASKECAICLEELDENWGLVHGFSTHTGYCRQCAIKVFRDRKGCPQCRLNIKSYIKIYGI